MTVKLNHTIVASRDPKRSALFLSGILGLEAPRRLGPFAVVTVGDELTLDFLEADGDIASQHYAFLVSEVEFDAIFGRIRERGLPYWADPYKTKPGEINRWDDGRGVYFDDPDGHLLEILTRPYGSAGTSARNPHPLVAERLEPDDAAEAASREREPTGGAALARAERHDRSGLRRRPAA
jgi:catechol 2,3-dioxygenase-like lactoylglutathione lyase family enzyme